MVKEVLDDIRDSAPTKITVDETLTRGVDAVYPDAESLKALMDQRPIKLYLGIDATSPHLHIGHTVPLRELSRFQQLGHHVNLLFGGFTSLIGDPSDKSAARKKQTPEQVATNMATYLYQAGKVLDLSPNAATPINVVNNNDWLADMKFSDVIELASYFTLQQIEDRDVYRKRRLEDKPIWMHELMYILMQAEDSSAQNVDLEVGGSDQIFNMLAGRELVKRKNGHDKWVLAMKLIMDTAGKTKMGKSEGNALNVTDPADWKMESLMQWGDRTIIQSLEQLTTVRTDVVERVRTSLPKFMAGEKGGPVVLKESVSYRIIRDLDGKPEADFALEEFGRVKQQGELPSRIQEVDVDPNTELVEVLVQAGLASDRTDANTKLKGSTVFVDGELVKRNRKWGDKSDSLISIGKKTIRNIRRIKIE